MEIILLERIHRLGQMGDVVNVKPGYARNFLLPRKKALRATADNKKYFEAQKAKLMADNSARRAEAEVLAKKIDKLKVVILRQAGESGQLYGSVSARDVAEAVVKAGFEINRAQVAMDHPIKDVGLFQEHIHVHPEVSVVITVNVARSLDEARIQEEKGAAVQLSAEAKAKEEAEKAAVLAAQAAELAAADADAKEVSYKEERAAKKSKAKKADGDEAASEEA